MEPLARLSRRRGQSHEPSPDASAHRCLGAWEPYTSSRLRAENAVLRADHECWSRKTTRFCLLAVMCLAAALDMHASAPRESSSPVPLTITPDALTTAGDPDANLADGAALLQPRTNRVAGKAHGERTSQRPSRVAPASTRFRGYTREEVKALIRIHAAAYQIDASLPLAIAHCESGFKWNASNSRSSARGVFQYLSGTWRTTPEGRKGTSVFNTEAHIRMAVAHIATLGTAAWNASRSCWTKIPAAAFESQSQSDSQSATEARPASEPEPAPAPAPVPVNETAEPTEG